MRRRRVAFRGKRQNKMGAFLVTLVVVMLLVVVSIKSLDLKEKQAGYLAKQEQLDKELAEEEKRKEELEELRKYMQTKAYVEDVAKKKLGLVYPDEIIFQKDK